MKNMSDSSLTFTEVVPLLQRLIQFESPFFHEKEIMTFVAEWLTEHQLPCVIQEYHEEKFTNFHGMNVISAIDSGKDGPTIFLNGHLDTVRLCHGWTKDPFKGEIEGDRLYGLGALDMKSGCAALMIAVKVFCQHHDQFKGKIILSLVSDEEGPYGLGTDALINSNVGHDADVSIVAEPSSGFTGEPFPCLCLGARGGYEIFVEFFGLSAHAATPELGVNAAVEAAKMMAQLSEIPFREDPLLGKGCLCVTKAESDSGSCSVPDYAKVQIFRHIVNGETKETIRGELEEVIRKSGVACRHRISFRQSPTPGTEAFLPYAVQESNPYVQLLKQSAKEITGKEPTIAYFQSIGDFNYIGTRIDAPCIIFGTAGANFHGADEYTSISSLTQTTEVLYDYLTKLLTEE